MKKKIITLCMMITLLSSFVGCGNQSKKEVSKTGFYFDTLISITLYETDDEAPIDECFNLANQYEKLLSNTIESSDISKINNNPNQFVEVNDITIDVLKKALYYCELSEGTFDITIGKLSELWDISNVCKTLDPETMEADKSSIPSSESIHSLLDDIDYHNIQIDRNQVCLSNSNSKIDLGGIAKGFIADVMKQKLNEQGITKGIINLGGNIITLGPKENNQTYCIGIQDPYKESGEVLIALNVFDSSIVTSGIYERYFKVDSKVYHHILDKSTGYPVENNLYSVTILSSSSCDGDALSTIAFMLGSSNGKQLIETIDGVEAIFVTDNSIIYTSGAQKYVE